MNSSMELVKLLLFWGGGRLYTGRFLGADRHIRRGGSGAVWGGDACVALAGGGKACTGRGRRKRPFPTQPYPRPYGNEGASEATS